MWGVKSSGAFQKKDSSLGKERGTLFRYAFRFVQGEEVTTEVGCLVIRAVEVS